MDFSKIDLTALMGGVLVSNSRGIRAARSGDVAIERRGRDAKAVRNLRNADIGIGEQCPRGFKVFLCKLRRSPAGAAEAPSGGKTCFGALADQAALELRQRTKHMKNEPPLRSRRVEGFGQAAKPDASHPQVLDGFDQLLH